VVKAHTFVGVQHHGERFWFNYAGTETNVWAGIQWLWRPVAGGRQHLTPTILPKAFLEWPGRMLFWSRQNMCRRLSHASKISRNFTGKWKFGL